MSASKKSMTDSGRSTSDRSGWVAYMKRRAGSWITSAEQLAERVGITRECVTNQLITKCHLSSELFTAIPFCGAVRSLRLQLPIRESNQANPLQIYRGKPSRIEEVHERKLSAGTSWEPWVINQSADNGPQSGRI